MTDTADATSAYHPTPMPSGPVYRYVVPNVGGIAALLLLPLALTGMLPVAAWAIAFAMWVLNRMGHALVIGMVNGLPKTMAVGAAGLGMMLRVWTIAIVLFFVGADMNAGGTHIGMGREDLAVPAMLLFMLIFTFDVAARALAELRRYKLGNEAEKSEEAPA